MSFRTQCDTVHGMHVISKWRLRHYVAIVLRILKNSDSSGDLRGHALGLLGEGVVEETRAGRLFRASHMESHRWPGRLRKGSCQAEVSFCSEMM